MQSKDSFRSSSEHWMVIDAKTDEVINLMPKDGGHSYENEILPLMLNHLGKVKSENYIQAHFSIIK